MKKLIITCLATLLPLLATATEWHIYDAASRLYYAIDDVTGYCEVDKNNYGDYSGSYTVPFCVNMNGTAYLVQGIGEEAFARNAISEFHSISVDLSDCDYMTEIKRSAFRYAGLASLKLPSSLTAIRDSAFYGNIKLEEVTMPQTVKTLGAHAFHNCSKLKTLTLSSKLSVIPEYCFKYCEALQEVTIPNSVVTIGAHAFEKCRQLATINLGNSVNRIMDSAFRDCGAITLYSFPNTLSYIGDYAFAYPASLQGVNASYFSFGTNLRTIGAHAFEKCHFLSISFPDQLESIGDSAFFSNFRATVTLENVKFGKGLTHIGHNAFADNHSLSNVTVSNRELLTGVEDDSFDFHPGSTSHTLHVPADFLTLYKNSSLWKRFFGTFVGDGPEVTYPLWVGETRVTTANRQNIPVSSGTAKYDPTSNVLTLTNAIITTTAQGEYCISNGDPEISIKGIDGLTISVNGTCKFTSGDHAIGLNANTTLSGTGQLTLKSSQNAICLGGNTELTCDVKSITASASKEVIYGDASTSKMTVTGNTTMTCIPLGTNFKTIAGLGSLTLSGSRYSDPGGEWKYSDTSLFAYNTSERCLKHGSEIYKKMVIIEPTSAPVKYRLLVGEVIVTSSNKDNIPVGWSGSASYNPSTHTLTLNNFDLECEYQGEYAISNGDINTGKEGIPDLKIVVNGYAILFAQSAVFHINGGTTTIVGDGMTLESYYEDVIQLGSGTTLNLNCSSVYARAYYGNVIYGPSDNSATVNLNNLVMTALAPENGQYYTIHRLKDFVLNGCYYRNSGSYDASKFAFDKNRHYLTYDGAPYYGNLSISTVPPTPQIPTTVDGVVADDKQSDSIYTLDGRHLNALPQRGVFIRNGKKVGRR